MKLTGRVSVEVKIESARDVYLQGRDDMQRGSVRTLQSANAIADVDEADLKLSPEAITTLGLQITGQRGVRRTFDPVVLTVMGRSCTMEVVQSSKDQPIIVGRIPLLALDLVVDSAKGCVTGNPAHGGEWIIEMY